MSDKVHTLTDADFDNQVLQSDIPTLVDFWAEWCGPCRTLAPVVADFADSNDGKVKVCKMNIDEHPNTPSKYAIRAIPTLLLFKGGEVVEQLVGLVTKDKLNEAITQHVG
ncbi:MAG: thioredoxin [Myxococcota bacterium]|nr:thioredoxin [Myxococcota bacterium]